jgi:chemotaxis protein MotB
MDTDKYSMFESGSARIRPDAEPAFKQIVDVIKRYPNQVEIYGHTDAQPFPTRTGGYTNWELSADRANSARRLIETQGYPAARILSVTGKASSEPRKPQLPLDPSNRRITFKLLFQTTTQFMRDEKSDTVYNDPLKELLRSKSDNKAAEQTPAAQDAAVAGAAPTQSGATSATVESTVESTVGSTVEPTVEQPTPEPTSINRDYMPKDKIFDNSPVLGPNDLLN